ncbi:MAG TPA: ATP-binding protein [Candidatus Limnocylindrales bacterium]|jgi:signal transduction histidine kinase|nr:ATP-binding protein [Candidatus Limnocylindrales bacterium]
MNPMTALSLLFAGISLWIRRDVSNPPAARYYFYIALGLAFLVSLIGVLRLIDAVVSLPFHVDYLLFPNRLDIPGPSPPEEMAPNTAFGLLFCGLGLLFYDWRTHKEFRPAQAFVLLTALLALLALIGHLYHVLLLNRLGSALPMSLDTAVALELFCMSFLAAQSHAGVMAVITSRTVGGAVARRLIPTAVLVPCLLGLLLLMGEQAGYYGRESALSIFAAGTIVIFTGLIWWNARLLHLADLERARAEEQLRQTSLNLQRSNTDLEQFAYVASHDLFEPLRMVTSYLQLFRQQYKELVDKQGKEFIEFALEGAKRMEALIHDLLAYSRVDMRGRAFEPTDCEQAFNAAVTNLKIALQESAASITHSPLPRVLADKIQLTQVFQNLIGNALKFRGDRPPQITVAAVRQENEWIFSVRDNGIGIDSKDFNRIFVIFQRLHTRQEYAGTGIGLALCKKIIERHGGRIWVESSPGQGSSFYFALPMLEEVEKP